MKSHSLNFSNSSVFKHCEVSSIYQEYIVWTTDTFYQLNQILAYIAFGILDYFPMKNK